MGWGLLIEVFGNQPAIRSFCLAYVVVVRDVGIVWILKAILRTLLPPAFKTIG
ncbi:MAG: hypothetical protein JXB29_09345 [Sedimentisphaerales bacterium]|nr:hypothetical protein [Sedimentisphaerales bacterium]